MTHREALEVLAAHRGQHVVVTTHGSVDPWVSLSDTPLDFSYVPASMGQGPALGLGLALAQGRHGVVVVSGDGSLLMNLGCLVTIAAHPADLYLIVIDNGVYEVTGGQLHAGGGHVDFAALACAAGVRRVYSCRTLEEWRRAAAAALSGPGPVVVWLEVAARPGQRAPSAMRPMAEQVARLRRQLGAEQPAAAAPVAISLRTDLRPGDLGEMVRLHGVVYARECGFDHAFEAYVAAPLAEFVRGGSARERLWLAEREGRLVGCVAIVAAAPDVAQLRWFLVDPAARGRGLGRRLLGEAVSFARACGYRAVILWTVSALAAAARLYRAAGFLKAEERPRRLWGVDVDEERYELVLR
jgi:ribosomal protein S18 acetylase RimI-like enzyme